MKKRIKNEEIDEIRDKIETIFLTAKIFNESVDSLNVLDGMLICTSEKVSEDRIKEEINGIRLYLGEIIKEMENLSEL